MVDYRALNQVTKGDGYPILSVSNILDTLGGGEILQNWTLPVYWQVPVNPQHIPNTAFVTYLGLFDFLRMSYGLKTTSQTFQCILSTVYSDFLYQWLIIYIYDIVIWSSEPTEPLQQYEKVFQRAQKFVLQFKPQKCYFFSENLEILGHRITPAGCFLTAKGTEAIVNMPRPHNARGVKRFIGMVGYFREYIENMSTRTQHLRSLSCITVYPLSGELTMNMSLMILKTPWYLQMLCFTTPTGMPLLRCIQTLQSWDVG